jgi:hypothetical protein
VFKDRLVIAELAKCVLGVRDVMIDAHLSPGLEAIDADGQKRVLDFGFSWTFLLPARHENSSGFRPTDGGRGRVVSMKRSLWPALLRLIDLLVTLDAKDKAEQAQPTVKVLRMPERTSHQSRDRGERERH